MDINKLWSEYQSHLKAFLHSRVSDAAEVDDLLQTILIKVYKNLDSLESEASVKSWLFQIANRAIIDHYRTEGRTTNLNSDDLWYSEDEAGLEDDLSRCVVPFINSLPNEEASLLRAIDLEGQSQKDYALAHNISYSTLKSRVHKARDLLRKQFLHCCRMALDSQGNIYDYESKTGNCDNC